MDYCPQQFHFKSKVYPDFRLDPHLSYLRVPGAPSGLYIQRRGSSGSSSGKTDVSLKSWQTYGCPGAPHHYRKCQDSPVQFYRSTVGDGCWPPFFWGDMTEISAIILPSSSWISIGGGLYLRTLPILNILSLRKQR
ncbi:hypothetical protein J6590_069460 [Homalodisca vitripennis]|nr:hypothetical protein J6590_069460 [Homalodisca vitripennis]